METTAKKSAKKSTAKIDHARLVSSYLEQLLNTGKRPASVFKFSSDIGIKEEEFYNHFGSFEGVERFIWKSFITSTTERLHADASFGSFSSREKILAFYYTLFEEMKGFRSFVLLQFEHQRMPEAVPVFLKDFKVSFENFIETILRSGITTGEVARRPYLDSRYPKLFWIHVGFLLNFWKNDNSPGFEQTDAAIEKSVNLAFDLIGKGAVDSAIDFAKFVYQTRMK